MQNKEAAIAAIRTCKTKEALEQMLETFKIKETDIEPLSTIFGIFTIFIIIRQYNLNINHLTIY